MRLHRLDDLVADLVEGVQRGQRVLEDHRDVVAADPAQVVVGRAQQVAGRRSARRRRCGRVAARVRPITVSDETRLAGARLADDAERLAAVDAVGDAVDGLHEAVLGREVDAQVLDLEQRHQPVRVGDYRVSSAPAGRGTRTAMSTTRFAMTMKNAPSSTVPWIIGRSLLLDRVVGEPADAGDVEDGLGQDRAAEQDADVEAGGGDDRRDRARTPWRKTTAARAGPSPARCGCSPRASSRSGCARSSRA